ncbi:hypothetical protein LEMLEM_LOCUS6830 [Lemmus lemmus]
MTGILPAAPFKFSRHVVDLQITFQWALRRERFYAVILSKIAP